MRKLQKELLNKKMSLHQALMSMDVLNPDYDKLKQEVNRFDDIYDRYMSCCGYTRYWYIAGNNYYGDYHVVSVWLKGDRNTLAGYKLYTNRIEAELVCNHLITDSDMTKEEAKERFGDNIINKLLSLGAEPTNVCRAAVS